MYPVVLALVWLWRLMWPVLCVICQSVTLHTSHGDLKLELACAEAPKTCEVPPPLRVMRLSVPVFASGSRVGAGCRAGAVQNFLALAASGYYNGTKFHRNIRGFMVQAGDPTGTTSYSALVGMPAVLTSLRGLQVLAKAARAFGAASSRTSSTHFCA